MKLDDVVKYLFYIILTVCGFLLATVYNRTNESLAQINADIIQLRIDVSEINSKMMTDERVRELIHLELQR